MMMKRRAMLLFTAMAAALILVGGTTALAVTYTPSKTVALMLNKPSYVASAATKLYSKAVGPALTLGTHSTSSSATPLSLDTNNGSQAPMKVDSETKVVNLNADTVDGSSAPLWAHVNSDGTLVRGNGVQSSGRFSTGYYFVQFNRDVSFCGYVATTTDGYAGPTGTVQGAAYGYPQEVFVYTVAGTSRVDLPFHVVVNC